MDECPGVLRYKTAGNWELRMRLLSELQASQQQRVRAEEPGSVLWAGDAQVVPGQLGMLGCTPYFEAPWQFVPSPLSWYLEAISPSQNRQHLFL